MFRTIKLTNFRHFKNQELELGPGLWCIVGENGVGKSTIIEAINFMMYGSKYLRGKVSASIGPKTSIEVSGVFPQDFTIKRVGNQTEFHSQETLLTRAADIKEYFESSFCSAEVFTTVFVAHQRAISEIALLRPGERKRRLCELLGLSAVEKASEVLRTQIRSLHRPTSSVDQVDKDLEDLSFLQGLDINRISQVKALQEEFARVEALPMTPEKAREQLEEITPLILELRQAADILTGEAQFKKGMLQHISTQESCPLCYSKIDPTNLTKQLQTNVIDLRQKATSIYEQVAPLEQMKITYSNTVPHRSLKAISQDLGNDAQLDVADLWPRIIDANRSKGRLDHLKEEWAEYESHQGILQLGLHFQEFLPYIMADKFRRLEELVTGYLSEYSPFRAFRMDDEGNMFVDDKTLKNLSVGQCDLVCLIFRVALAQMFGEEKFGQPPIAIFDSSFDAIDNNNMALALELLADAPFKQVIVTSHNEAVARRLGLNTLVLESQ